jgi:trehalose 6-phosphate phosphatase
MRSWQPALDELTRKIKGRQVCLFLDYDGTLAEFAATPEDVQVNPQVLEVLRRLVEVKNIHPMIISGRRLQHLKALVPLEHITLVGTYGIELQLPGGEQIERIAYDAVRPFLEQLKPDWEKLASLEQGYFLEDKGWTLAMHARYAEDDEAEYTLKRALERVKARGMPDLFQILGGHKFLEIAPRIANKGEAVEYLLKNDACEAPVLIYMGDDDKDEDAFGVVKRRGGVGIRVGEEARASAAEYHLATPGEVREWLAQLVGDGLN